MVMLNQDLPIKLKDWRNSQQDYNTSPTSPPIITSILGKLPPGAGSVRGTEKRGTGYYCRLCLKFISPLWIRSGMWVYPACRDCFKEELALLGTDVMPAQEVKDVAILESVAEPTKDSSVTPHN
jgi:hypothetical protein